MATKYVTVILKKETWNISTGTSVETVCESRPKAVAYLQKKYGSRLKESDDKLKTFELPYDKVSGCSVCFVFAKRKFR